MSSLSLVGQFHRLWGTRVSPYRYVKTTGRYLHLTLYLKGDAGIAKGKQTWAAVRVWEGGFVVVVFLKGVGGGERS